MPIAPPTITRRVTRVGLIRFWITGAGSKVVAERGCALSSVTSPAYQAWSGIIGRGCVPEAASSAA